EEAVVKEEIAKLKRKSRRLHNKLTEIGPVMRGSIAMIGTRKKQYHFSLNKDKKTRLLYLGAKRVETAREYSANYQKMVEIIDEMILLKENTVNLIDSDAHNRPILSISGILMKVG
ncbi:hypothetical protein K8T06_09680, partial [bacterium]|nr:hypothetical protein [bacterium]